MREDLIIAFSAWADIDMAAFARHRHPCMACADKTGNAKPRARSEYDAGGNHFFRLAANLFQMIAAERHDGKRLRLEIVQHGHVLETEIGDHLLRTHDPVAIGEVDFVTVDGTGHGENCGAWPDRSVIKNGALYRLIDGCIIRCLENGKFLRLCIGIHQDSKAGIGAADIADEYWKPETLFDQLYLFVFMHVFVPKPVPTFGRHAVVASMSSPWSCLPPAVVFRGRACLVQD